MTSLKNLTRHSAAAREVFNVNAHTDFEREVSGIHPLKVAYFVTTAAEWDAPQAQGSWQITLKGQRIARVAELSHKAIYRALCPHFEKSESTQFYEGFERCDETKTVMVRISGYEA